MKAANSALDKETLVAAMESKVSMAITTIRSKIEVAQRELEKAGFRAKNTARDSIQVLTMNLDLLGVKHVASNNVPNLQVSQ